MGSWQEKPTLKPLADHNTCLPGESFPLGPLELQDTAQQEEQDPCTDQFLCKCLFKAASKIWIRERPLLKTRGA